MKKSTPPAHTFPAPPANSPTAPKMGRGRRETADVYAAARAAKLDQQTPKWPELRVEINEDHSSITASGITHDLSGADPQSQAVTFAADMARTNGQPIRMTATMAAGDVHRMIITPQRCVVLLDHARPTGSAQAPNTGIKTPPAGRKSKANKQAGRARSANILSRFPSRLQPVIKWGAPAGAILLVTLITVAIVKGPQHTQMPEIIAQQDHPVPAAGTLYTVTAPPGWSQRAIWSVALADQSTTYTDPDTGVTAALTPDDRSTTQSAHDTEPNIAAHQVNYLSVLSPDGSTRFAEPLTATPIYGPVITTVDGAKVVLLQESSATLTYWPITGGASTTLALPAGASGPLNTTGPSVMVPLSQQRVGYLRRGAFQIVEALPLTAPMFALDGSIVSVQPETGAWWSQRIEASPTSVTPAAPAGAAGAAGIDQVLAITPQHVIISWKAAAPAGSYSAPDLVTAYDLTSGKIIAQTNSRNALSPAQITYYNAQYNLTAADGFILSTPTGKPAKLTMIDGLHVLAVDDAVYGQNQGQPVVINAAGITHQLPASALTPVGGSTGRLMVTSQNQLYALPANPGRTAAAPLVLTAPAQLASTAAPKIATPAPPTPAVADTTAKQSTTVKVAPRTTPQPAASTTTTSTETKETAPTSTQTTKSSATKP